MNDRKHWNSYTLSPMDWAVLRPPAAAEAVWRILWDHRNWKHGNCWPSQARIAALTGLSHESIRRGVNWLVDGGWISADRGSGKQSSSYKILWNAAEGCPAYGERYLGPVSGASGGVENTPHIKATPHSEDSTPPTDVGFIPLENKEEGLRQNNNLLLRGGIEIGGKTCAALTPQVVIDLWEEIREDWNNEIADGKGLQEAKACQLPHAAHLLSFFRDRAHPDHPLDQIIDLFSWVNVTPFHRGNHPNKTGMGTDFIWVCKNPQTILDHGDPFPAYVARNQGSRHA